MSQAGTVLRLATRELWMTFRLLLVLVASVGAGAVVGLLPAPLPGAMSRLAIGLGVATVLAGAIAAWSMAEERLSGRAGWLVTRSVPRATYLVGWFGALMLVAVAGVAAGAALGWLAIPRVSTIDPVEYPAAILAVAATVGVAIAAGLLAGALLRPRGATIVTVAACAAAAAGVILLPAVSSWLPGAALLVLSRSADPGPVSPDALRAAGIALALAATILVLCRLALERADL